LLHLCRDTGAITHHQVSALPELLRAGDLVVVNNTKVFPARLLGPRVPISVLHLCRDTGAITHHQVSALPELLRAGDLVVVNNTKVFPARLLGHRVPSRGAVGWLLIRSRSDRHAAALDAR